MKNLFCLFLTVLFGQSAVAQTKTWTGTESTAWNAANNWSPAGEPAATDIVVLPAAPVNQPTISTVAVAQSVEVQAGATLTTVATGSLTINGSKGYLISSITYTIGFYNAGTVHHNGQLILGNTAAVGQYGLFNTAIFNNNADAEIGIDRSTNTGLYNYLGATFHNAGTIIVGAAASAGSWGLGNNGTFNHTNGEIHIDRTTQVGLYNLFNGGNFTNSAKIIIGANASVGLYGLNNTKNFTNTAGGEIAIDRSTVVALKNDYSTVFTNAGKITLGATANVGNYGLNNQGIFNHNAGGVLTIDRPTIGGISNGFGTFTNAAVITIGAAGGVGTYGINNTGGTLNNNNCGKIIVANGTLRNASSFTNAGLFQLADNLNNSSTFTNTGVLKYGSLTGSVTNSAIIVNNTPTPIFTYGGTYDGVVNGIFADSAATVLAGTFSAPNAFTPAPALPSGSQTLYAKITPNVGTCSYAVPFTYVNPAAIADYTISTAGDMIVVTDVSGAGETLSVSESGSDIRFAVTGKTYSLNGGSITSFTTTPATIGIAGKTGIILNAGGGDDVIQVGAFTTVFPSLTINGGPGNDQVFMNGSITFSPGAILDLDLHNDDAAPGLDAVTISTGANLVLSAATMAKATVTVK